MSSLHWKDAGQFIYMLFRDEEYLGKLFFTIVGGSLTGATFCTVQHKRSYIPVQTLPFVNPALLKLFPTDSELQQSVVRSVKQYVEQQQQ